MKTDREKLTEILKSKDNPVWRAFVSPIWFDDFLDYLISKGVTIPVRCWECKHHGQYTITGNIYCKHQNGLTDPKAYDFCSYGERKEE